LNGRIHAVAEKELFQNLMPCCTGSGGSRNGLAPTDQLFLLVKAPVPVELKYASSGFKVGLLQQLY
jgi:hypothetical protein